MVKQWYIQNNFLKTEDQADHDISNDCYITMTMNLYTTIVCTMYVLSHVLCYKTSNLVGGPSSCKMLDLFSLGLPKTNENLHKSF